MKEKKHNSGQVHIDVPPTPEINKALARTGYDSWQALCEVIDNGSDAIKRWSEEQGAQNVETIHVIPKNWESESSDRELIVIDTGCGLDNDSYSLAHVWGLGESSESKTQNTEKLYGVFGIGLKAATMSIAISATFTSRSTLEQKFRTSVYNPEQQRKRGDWKVPVNDLIEGTTEHWAVNKYLENQVGTVLVLRGLQEEFPVKQSNFYNRLSEMASRIYRKDLKDSIYQIKLGKNRTLDENSTIDPLFSSDPSHNSDWFYGGPDHADTFVFDGLTFEIRACHTKIGHGGRNQRKSSTNLGSGIGGTYKRGVYFLRNYREIGILSGDDSGFWILSSASNFFVEINFLDDGNSNDLPVQTDFGKKSVKMTPKFVSYMRKKLEACVKKVSAYKVKTKSPSVDDTKKQFEQIVGSAVKVQRKDATKSTKSSTEVVGSTNNRVYRTKNTYRGKSNEPFYVDYSDGYRAKVTFEHIDDPMRRDFPFWEEQQKDGLKIFINEASSYVSDMIKIDENYRLLYKTAAGIVLALSNNIQNSGERTDCLGGFGFLVNDFTDKERRIEVTEVANIELEKTNFGDIAIAASGQ